MVTMESDADFERRLAERRRAGRELGRAYRRDKRRILHRTCSACDTPSSECLHNDGCCAACIASDFLAGTLHRW